MTHPVLGEGEGPPSVSLLRSTKKDTQQKQKQKKGGAERGIDVRTGIAEPSAHCSSTDHKIDPTVLLSVQAVDIHMKARTPRLHLRVRICVGITQMVNIYNYCG